MSQLHLIIQVDLFQIINDVFYGIVLKSSLSEFTQYNLLRAREKA
jgi:hypothetical protein